MLSRVIKIHDDLLILSILSILYKRADIKHTHSVFLYLTHLSGVTPYILRQIRGTKAEPLDIILLNSLVYIIMFARLEVKNRRHSVKKVRNWWR